MYKDVGRREEALRRRRDVYSGILKMYGEEHGEALREAFNYANDLFDLRRFEEAKSLLRRQIPVAQRVLGKSNDLTLTMRSVYANALYGDPGATLADLRESVETLEDAVRIARRVLGGPHPRVANMERAQKNARTVLRARETLSPGST